jgi:hypothetical protein
MNSNFYKLKQSCVYRTVLKMRELRDDFRTLDWVEVWEGLRYSNSNIDELLNKKKSYISR